MAVQIRYEPPALNPGVVMHALVEAAETAGAEALLEATKPDVPFDTGELQASGHVEHGPDGAAVIFSAVSPDGFDRAAIQHEREDFHHERGKAHYLGDQMHQARGAIGAAIVVELRKS